MQGLANRYLCILVRCKECQHTERNRNIQGVQMVPSLLEYPSDPEGREAQRSQKDLGNLFSTLLVALRMGERGWVSLKHKTCDTAQLKVLSCVELPHATPIQHPPDTPIPPASTV